ncbi:ATP-dependent DNA helicase [Pimelobacter simplex]|uniref:DNA 3'-5' helicase n=1 Tax=Nocardioides simplex TaxID=2045 RepID=A0A0A1DQW9_NOCSI|nr:ATP-dependent DNA helicase [Pimelobacter simplex]AIY19821.2 ATP-dependent DNA helicase [Pimelobacter simplex]GEB12785.1 ATP-dependent DNA helicase [Pimelobacter simplex]
MSTTIPMTIATPADLQRAMQAPFPPSDEQWAAISAPLRPAVVIAGAGSGKTTLMAARVVYLVLTGQVRPEEVLGLTFTTKAAAELRQRIRTALRDAGALDLSGPASGPDEADEVLEPTVATYNAYASGLLTDHGLRIGHEPDTRVITDAARYQLGARAVDRFTGEIALLTDHPETAIQNLLALDSAMSEHLVGPDDVLAHDAAARRGFERARDEELAGKGRKTYVDAVEKAISAIDRRGELLQLVASYRGLKRDLGLMDFSDQIELGARLAAERPEVGEIERGRFKVVLLDEYQDTSVAQAIMLSRLFSAPEPGQGLGHAVTAVGDPNQAIYGWRGASVANILNFAQTFPAADGTPTTYALTVNRRSDRRILDVASHLAEPLYDALETRGAGVARLRAPEGAVDGTVEARTFETQRDELAWLAAEVRAAHGGDPGDWAHIGVLTRDNAHAELVFDALTTAGVPVEIVGLSGLLRLPEIAEIVAVLRLLHDVTDNAALLTLLAGPRWAIGPRDLRLLGQRAGELAGRRGRSADVVTVSEQLVAIADGIDPAEVPCLDDALADPGEGDFSAEARERFGLLRDELRLLRAAVGEPLLDLVRRIIDVTGVDVELASAVSPAAAARRDNLDLFVKAVADFQAVDGDVSLPALLAYLTAEDDQGNGLDIATPTEADSVKLLTVHRSKGLEWATVFCVGVCESRFPSAQGRTLWVSSPAVLPAALRGDAADLPQLEGYDKAALDDYRRRSKAHEADEELRLGYVAFTRAAHRLAVSSFQWGPRKTPYGPSAYQEAVREMLTAWDLAPEPWLTRPDKGAANPYDAEDPARPWPADGVGDEARLRLAAAALVGAADPDGPDPELDIVTAARVAEWDAEIEQLLAEARLASGAGGEVVVPMPASLSATALSRLRDDPQAFARELVRPMPRPPAPAARFGTRFHAWVEARFGQQGLFDPDELSGRADAGIDDEADLKELVAAFEEGPFGSRVPYAVEAPFALVLDAADGRRQVIRGRIDAVYAEPDGSFLVVDWKTSARQEADPLQLAVYRLAWAELRGLPPERVRAGFYYVRRGELVVHDELAGREEVLSLLG